MIVCNKLIMKYYDLVRITAADNRTSGDCTVDPISYFVDFVSEYCSRKDGVYDRYPLPYDPLGG